MHRPTLRSATGTSPATLFVLLGLAMEPCHGYELRSRIVGDSVGAVALGQSTIYALLKELERDGLIESNPTRARREPRVYHLTPTGRDELRRASRIYERVGVLAHQRLR